MGCAGEPTAVPGAVALARCTCTWRQALHAPAWPPARWPAPSPPPCTPPRAPRAPPSRAAAAPPRRARAPRAAPPPPLPPTERARARRTPHTAQQVRVRARARPLLPNAAPPAARRAGPAAPHLGHAGVALAHKGHQLADRVVVLLARRARQLAVLLLHAPPHLPARTHARARRGSAPAAAHTYTLAPSLTALSGRKQALHRVTGCRPRTHLLGAVAALYMCAQAKLLAVAKCVHSA